MRHEMSGGWRIVFFAAIWASLFIAFALIYILMPKQDGSGFMEAPPFVLLISATWIAGCLFVPWAVNNQPIAENWAFVLTRPVTRQFYFRAKTCAFLALFLLPTFFQHLIPIAQPDLRLLLSGFRTTTLGMDIAEYQNAFPDAHLITAHDRSFFILPGGVFKAAWWMTTATFGYLVITQLFCSLAMAVPRTRKNLQAFWLFLP